MTAIHEASNAVRLVDHHCHGLMRDDLDRQGFELLATESDWPQPAGQTIFVSPVGLTIRAECAPLLGLERHASAVEYWQARSELGQAATSALLMPTTGIDNLLIDTGFRSTSILGMAEMQTLSDATTHEIVRLESVAESIATTTSAATFADDYAAELALRASTAVGFKSIIAYRHGLDFDPDRPTKDEVRSAAEEWLAVLDPAHPRLGNPVLLRFVLWAAIDLAKPIQFHVGYGDSDITLHRCDPTQMTEFLRRTVHSGSQIMLLHCYPFLREAGFLAQVFPHVWLDTGAVLNYTGPSFRTTVGHALELAPFSKILFSSDAFGLPELYLCGALLWRRGVADVIDQWVQRDEISLRDGLRYIEMMGRANALRAYGIETA
jgi:predicted TIM-barrel fold metal-dependent hydrolase